MSGDPTNQSGSRPSPGSSLSPTEIAQRQQQAMVQAAMRGSVQRFYVNNIYLALTASDINLVMFLNGAPIVNVSVAYSTAKQLASDLQKAINDVERGMEQQIKSLSDMQQAIQKVGS
jgi:hypothetical protein